MCYSKPPDLSFEGTNLPDIYSSRVTWPLVIPFFYRWLISWLQAFRRIQKELFCKYSGIWACGSSTENKIWIIDCFPWKGLWTGGSLYSSVRMGKKFYPRSVGSEQVTTPEKMVKFTLAFCLQAHWPYRQEGSGSAGGGLFWRQGMLQGETDLSPWERMNDMA